MAANLIRPIPQFTTDTFEIRPRLLFNGMPYAPDLVDSSKNRDEPGFYRDPDYKLYPDTGFRNMAPTPVDE